MGDRGLGTFLGRLHPDGDVVSVNMLPAFLMQWVAPDIVLDAIALAQSARFEFGQTPQVVPLPNTRTVPRLAAAR